jgi:hypothetical protein
MVSWIKKTEWRSLKAVVPLDHWTETHPCETEKSG